MEDKCKKNVFALKYKKNAPNKAYLGTKRLNKIRNGSNYFSRKCKQSTQKRNLEHLTDLFYSQTPIDA